LPAKRNWRDAVVLASRSDTGEGEAFTGGGMLFPPKTFLIPRSGTGATQSYWHREAILAKAKPLLAAGCSSPPRTALLALIPRSGTGATQSYWHREAILAKAKPLLAAGCSSPPRTALLALQGRVHALGRWSKDGS